VSINGGHGEAVMTVEEEDDLEPKVGEIILNPQ